jgi:ubiquinone/menaquinone biosynthesis C-methylase UbiE
MPNPVERYYDLSSANEWARLERNRTEYAVTLRALKDYLPPPPARVLDCGGGPGRYAIELTRQGYAVTLFDLSRINLSFARTQAHAASVSLAGYEHGTATDLSRFPNDSFNVVLLQGPLYHLLIDSEREAALRETYRVVKPGGVMIAAFITRYAFLRYISNEKPEDLHQRAAEIETFWQTGVLPTPLTSDGGFVAHLVFPADVRPLVESAGFNVRALLGVEGLSTLIDDKVNALQGEAWEAWVEMNYRAAADSSLHGASDHLLCVAEKADR